jgi:hypothetical protein
VDGKPKYQKGQDSDLEHHLDLVLTTVAIRVSPQPALTSTSTGYASIPLTAAEQSLANMDQLFVGYGEEAHTGTVSM